MNQGFCHQLVQIVKAAGSFAAQLVDVLRYWSKIGYWCSSADSSLAEKT